MLRGMAASSPPRQPQAGKKKRRRRPPGAPPPDSSPLAALRPSARGAAATHTSTRSHASPASPSDESTGSPRVSGWQRCGCDGGCVDAAAGTRVCCFSVSACVSSQSVAVPSSTHCRRLGCGGRPALLCAAQPPPTAPMVYPLAPSQVPRLASSAGSPDGPESLASPSALSVGLLSPVRHGGGSTVTWSPLHDDSVETSMLLPGAANRSGSVVTAQPSTSSLTPRQQLQVAMRRKHKEQERLVAIVREKQARWKAGPTDDELACVRCPLPVARCPLPSMAVVRH